MEELINRQATLAEIDANIAGSIQIPEDVYIDKGLKMARKIIEKMPSVEARPVQHAYWEPSDVGEYHCTNCGAECDIDKFHKALLNLFCGKCGARMDGGADKRCG